MKQTQWQLIAGILLVAAGALLLMQTFGIFAFLWDLLWAVIAMVGGGAFLVLFLTREEQWWAAIPGMALVGLGAVVGASFVGLGRVFGGAAFLAALSLAFWLIYLRARDRWWAIIPGGALLTLAAIAGLGAILPWADLGGVFFLGLAVTFGLVFLLPHPGGRRGWALIPAGVLLVVGIVVTLSTYPVISYIWPILLILVGGFFVVRALRRQ